MTETLCIHMYYIKRKMHEAYNYTFIINIFPFVHVHFTYEPSIIIYSTIHVL